MPKTQIPISGRVVAITGGARGLGLATAKVLASRGARVALGDLDGDLARVEAAALPGPGPHAGYALDVTDPESFESFLQQAAELGPLDVLVNNAGIMPVGAFAEEDPLVTRRQIEINVLGVTTGTRLALARMLPRGRGHVVNVASAAGRVAVPGEAIYTATKHAVVGFGEALRVELRGTGVDVSTIMPSLAATELASGMRPPRFVPMVQPEQVAGAIVKTLERPKLEVIVPAWITPLIRMTMALPPNARDRVRDFFRIGEVGSEIDPAARAAYVERYQRPVAADEHELAEY
ncbi:MAG TPA: SDR family oxidoreductase [Thermoleophilaceae bacterium]|nr:SDR family oxidoreductase [Thermoleophilaceae bacterium]